VFIKGATGIAAEALLLAGCARPDGAGGLEGGGLPVLVVVDVWAGVAGEEVGGDDVVGSAAAN
jgi:hypothetical protein